MAKTRQGTGNGEVGAPNHNGGGQDGVHTVLSSLPVLPSEAGRPHEWQNAVILVYRNGLHDQYRGRPMLRPGPEVPEDVRLTALAYVSIVELGLMMQANGHPLRLPSDTITKTAAAETAAKNFLTLINTLGGALGIPAVTHLDQIFEIHGLDGLLAAIGQSLELTMTPVPREQAVVFPEPVRRTGVIPGLAVEAAGTALNEAAYYYDALGFPDWTRAREQAFTLLGEKGELAAKLTPALGWFKTMRKLDKK